MLGGPKYEYANFILHNITRMCRDSDNKFKIVGVTLRWEINLALKFSKEDSIKYGPLGRALYNIRSDVGGS